MSIVARFLHFHALSFELNFFFDRRFPLNIAKVIMAQVIYFVLAIRLVGLQIMIALSHLLYIFFNEN